LYGHPGLAHPLIRYLQSSRLYTFVSFIYYISIIMYTLFYTYIYTHIVPSLSIVVFFTVCYADTHACYIYSIYMYNHHYYSIQLFKYILCVCVSVLYTISLYSILTYTHLQLYYIYMLPIYMYTYCPFSLICLPQMLTSHTTLHIYPRYFLCHDLLYLYIVLYNI
jgi:hypothetical protein